MKDFPRKISSGKIPFLLIALPVSIILIVGGYFYYQYEVNRILSEKYSYLKVVSGLKIDQFEGWQKERKADAVVLGRSKYLLKRIELLIKKSNPQLEKEIYNRISTVKHEYEYESISIINTELKVLVSTDIDSSLVQSSISGIIREVISTKKVLFSDFYKDQFNGKINFDMVAPMVNKKGKSIAVIIFRIDPDAYLYPLIQSWPDSRKSSETLIVRKDGGSVLFLNELRFKKNTALNLRIPLSEIKIPAVQAVMGRKGIFEGLDYRKKEVLSYISPVPNTGWFMITKIDENEILSELHYRAEITGILVLISILTLGVAVTLMYHSRQKRIYKELYFKEKDLSETKEQFRTTLYSIGDAVLTTDINGRVQQMNPVAERLTGYAESEIKNKPLEEIFNIIDEDSGRKVENPVNEVLKDGRRVGLSNHTILVSKEGRKIPIADSGAPIINNDGRITGVVLVFRDQTEERAKQKEITESEERFRSMVVRAPVPIFIQTENNFTYVNPAALSLFGAKSESELNGKPVLERIHPDFRAVVRERIRTLNEDLKPVHNLYEMKFIRSDGSYVWVDTVAEPIVYNGKNGALVFVRNIEKNKEKEFLLIESEKRYRKLFTSTIDGLCLHEIIYNEENNAVDYRILDVNPKYEEITKLSKSDAVGMLASKLYGTNSPPYLDVYAKVAETGEPYAFETYFPPMKKHFHILVFSPEQGKFATVFQDITKRKKTEEELQSLNDELEKRVAERTSQLESANKELEAFSYSVSHDLRSPLRAIDGFARILLDEYSPKLDDEGKRICNVIQENSIWMGKLIDDLLAFSRLNQSEIKKAKMNMKNLVYSIINEVVTENQKNSIEINVSELSDARCDPSMIKQVWINLISNAVKFSSQNPNPVISIQSKLEDGNIVYSIKDNGAGFDMKYVSKLFNVFQRLHSKKEFEGTGVGLAIVKRIITKHGGSVQAEGEIGNGATIYFSLPL